MIENSTVSGGESALYSVAYIGRNGEFKVGNGAATNSLAGAWKLVSIEDRRPDGEASYWMGRNPAGLIIYDPSGQMSVQFMRDPRPTFASEYKRATPDEIKGVYEGYFAYFGTYEVDEEKGVVTHHLLGSLRPQEVGMDYERSFSVAGDRLVLSAPVPGKNGGQTRDLIWERVK